MEYISSLPFRQQLTGSTNKVEKYHQFTDWISFGGEKLLVYDSEERDKRLKYLNLLANAVMVQNVVDLTGYLKELKGEGLVFSKEDVGSLSPYLTGHLKRFGEYVLDLDNQPDPLSEESLELPI